MSTALILLAAGASTRMGGPKQLLPFKRTTLLRHAASTALASRCSPVIVVLGSKAEDMRNHLADLPLQIVENLNWAKGMATSIRAGITAIKANPSVYAAIIMLCDQPAVTAELLDGLIDRYNQDRSTIVASFYANIAGVPALFGRTLFDDLLHLEDPAGARQLIQQHSNKAIYLPFPEGAIDVDTPKDLEGLI